MHVQSEQSGVVQLHARQCSQGQVQWSRVHVHIKCTQVKVHSRDVQYMQLSPVQCSHVQVQSSASAGWVQSRSSAVKYKCSQVQCSAVKCKSFASAVMCKCIQMQSSASTVKFNQVQVQSSVSALKCDCSQVWVHSSAMQWSHMQVPSNASAVKCKLGAIHEVHIVHKDWSTDSSPALICSYRPSLTSAN